VLKRDLHRLLPSDYGLMMLQRNLTFHRTTMKDHGFAKA